ncbi:SDR family NAD(P)-dependent oxidoreductase [Alteribacter populi]|uniref:SDR family NAD(P)-dependent oxidoreductase n=1 Tax=Alteribacter populi TaxID=2011011 RepID=UPI000BBA8100|nr:SDR family NAD(P)-dependent oxidoreductase [Alteribacter populi]
MKHALVIGGTGMLKEVTRWLVTQGYYVSVVGRSENKMDNLINHYEEGEMLNPIFADYQNSSYFQNEIKVAIQEYGAFSLIVAWVHSQGSESLSQLLREEMFTNADFFSCTWQQK